MLTTRNTSTARFWIAGCRICLRNRSKSIHVKADVEIWLGDMRKAEFQNHHAREAARLRSLIAVATTPAVKARLTEQAEESERLAYGFAEDEGEAEIAAGD